MEESIIGVPCLKIHDHLDFFSKSQYFHEIGGF